METNELRMILHRLIQQNDEIIRLLTYMAEEPEEEENEQNEQPRKEIRRKQEE